MERRSSQRSNKSNSSKASSKSNHITTDDEKMIEIINLFARHFEQETLSDKASLIDL